MILVFQRACTIPMRRGEPGWWRVVSWSFGGVVEECRVYHRRFWLRLGL